jgi:phospholipase A1
MRRLIVLGFLGIWILMADAFAFGGNLETIIVPPASPPQAGRTMEFYVYIHNDGNTSVSVQLPARLSCSIVSAGRNVEVSAIAARSARNTAAILGQSEFLKGGYTFTVPIGLAGPVRMEIRELDAAGVMFLVDASSQPKMQIATAVDSGSLEEYPTLDSIFALYQLYAVNLSAYEPMYFLVGTDPKKSKFQISFKYRFLNPEGSLAQNFPALTGMHFGYTQTSFWDLKSDSKPFEDTSYKPELFFLSTNIATRPSWMKGFFVRAGLQHESNGRAGEISRSTNFIYAKPIFILYDPKTRYGLQIAPKIWAYVNNDNETNPDLEDYRGFFELEIKLGKADSFVLGSYWRWASEGASMQLDLTYPIHRFLFNNVNLYLHVQYENALAESLLYFRERTEALRLGFSIVR